MPAAGACLAPGLAPPPGGVARAGTAFVPEPWPAVVALEEPALPLPGVEVPLAAGDLRRQERQGHA